MKLLSLPLLMLIGLSPIIAFASESAGPPPNVLFVAIDDLNDWITPFGGHSQAITPNLEAFADRGAMIFQNAHCAGPVCGPSRSALLSGFLPSTTGLYGNSQNMLHAELVQTHATLPEYFAKQGYHTISRGKIFHAHATKTGRDDGQWAFEEWLPRTRGVGVDRTRLYSRNQNIINGKPGPPSQYTRRGGSEFAWGPTKGPKEETGDYRNAQWAAEQLQRDFDQPFFMAIGFSKPHLPFYVPQEFFDLYDGVDVKANPIKRDDLDDILKPNGQPKFSPSDDYLWLEENDLLDEATHAYLAAVSYADACLGVLLDALEASAHADNTIVVVWGDHGWHLGEKLRFRKAAGWTEATRMPLMVRLPGMNRREDTTRAVNLIDLYPTLIDLCGLPAKPELDGRSFEPVLRDPMVAWDYPTITVLKEGGATIHDERWSYIRYDDGTEEVYDLRADPYEWNNLHAQRTPEVDAAVQRLAAVIPAKFTPTVRNSKLSDTDKNSEWAKRLDPTLKAKRVLEALR
ncbi:MAG: hypothetical protein SynsKO_13670 [Synoicihabitans sp.]